VWPMRKVAAIEAERRHLLELELRGRDAVSEDNEMTLQSWGSDPIEDIGYDDRPTTPAISTWSRAASRSALGGE
jgi:hypothetical protein